MDPRTATPPAPPIGQRPRLSVQEFNALSLPQEEGTWYELLDGELVVVKGAPRLVHQGVSSNLHRILSSRLHSSDRGVIYHHGTGTVLGTHTAALPDLVVVLKENFGILQKDGVHGPPDLIVEILSPGTLLNDTQTKRDIYAAQGVREYWIVDADGEALLQLVLEVSEYRAAGLHKGDASFHPHILPELEIHLAEVWKTPRPG